MDTAPKYLLEPKPFATVTVAVSKGDNFLQLDFTDHAGTTRRIVSPEFDMANVKERRSTVMNLVDVILYVIRKKIWPEDTPIYRTVQTERGFRTDLVGWPEELTEEQKKEFHVNGH